jgi:hypothetical protein
MAARDSRTLATLLAKVPIAMRADAEEIVDLASMEAATLKSSKSGRELIGIYALSKWIQTLDPRDPLWVEAQDFAREVADRSVADLWEAGDAKIAEEVTRKLSEVGLLS